MLLIITLTPISFPYLAFTALGTVGSFFLPRTPSSSGFCGITLAWDFSYFASFFLASFDGSFFLLIFLNTGLSQGLCSCASASLFSCPPLPSCPPLSLRHQTPFYIDNPQILISSMDFFRSICLPDSSIWVSKWYCKPKVTKTTFILCRLPHSAPIP